MKIAAKAKRLTGRRLTALAVALALAAVPLHVCADEIDVDLKL